MDYIYEYFGFRAHKRGGDGGIFEVEHLTMVVLVILLP